MIALGLLGRRSLEKLGDCAAPEARQVRLDKISNGSQAGDSADANAFCDPAVLINALSRR